LFAIKMLHQQSSTVPVPLSVRRPCALMVNVPQRPSFCAEVGTAEITNVEASGVPTNWMP
jgi:hypothetical protein